MSGLVTLLWLFSAAPPAQSTLTAESPQAEFAGPVNATDGFTVKFTVDLQPVMARRPARIQNVLSVRLRQHDPLDRNRQNYPAYRMPDGSVPVLKPVSCSIRSNILTGGT